MTASKMCAVQKTAQILSDTWTMLIVRDILGGPKRFCELERSLEGISTRTLTLKLKKLEEEKMILKSSEGLYMTTKKGKDLQTIEKAMRAYGEKHL